MLPFPSAFIRTVPPSPVLWNSCYSGGSIWYLSISSPFWKGRPPFLQAGTQTNFQLTAPSQFHWFIVMHNQQLDCGAQESWGLSVMCLHIEKLRHAGTRIFPSAQGCLSTTSEQLSYTTFMLEEHDFCFSILFCCFLWSCLGRKFCTFYFHPMPKAFFFFLALRRRKYFKHLLSSGCFFRQVGWCTKSHTKSTHT